jgi:hypothetical protein
LTSLRLLIIKANEMALSAREVGMALSAMEVRMTLSATEVRIALSVRRSGWKILTSLTDSQHN